MTVYEPREETLFKSIFSQLPVERLTKPGAWLFSINCSVVFSVLTLLAPTMQEHKTHVDLIGAISFY